MKLNHNRKAGRQKLKQRAEDAKRDLMGTAKTSPWVDQAIPFTLHIPVMKILINAA